MYVLSMVFLLARLSFIPAYRQAGISFCCDAPFKVLFILQHLRRSLSRAKRRIALALWFATEQFGKFKSPSSAWGLTGAKIATGQIQHFYVIH